MTRRSVDPLFRDIDKALKRLVRFQEHVEKQSRLNFKRLAQARIRTDKCLKTLAEAGKRTDRRLRELLKKAERHASKRNRA